MRTHRVRSLLGCLALVASATSVAANDGAGSNREAREALDSLGTCLAVVRADEVEAYLRDPGEDTWSRVTVRRNDEAPCVQLYSVTTRQTAMQGAAAEGWYLIKNANGAPAAFATAENTAPAEKEIAARIASANEQTRPQVIVDEFARCVAATNPLGVDRLLRTPVAGSEEAAAVRELSEGLPACAFEGQKLTFDSEMLRAALAFALARRAIGGW